MNNEMNYTQLMGTKHIKRYGQYFTNYKVADFMCAWACENAQTMLDPAVGNSVFFSHAQKYSPNCLMTGYELDNNILEYFGNPTSAKIITDDYLLNGWDRKYDAIVCNPPYNKFQDVANRSEVLDTIFEHTGVKYSGYTNLYILFLIKSLFQLTKKGRLAYIIPTEFMNSKYGTAIKQLMIDRRLLYAVINFKNNHEMFFNAITTCCILLLDHTDKTHVTFYNLNAIDELRNEMLYSADTPHTCVDYTELVASEKWRFYINREEPKAYKNLKPIAQFCSISRGIATGDNDFFCFSLPKAEQYGIPEQYLSKCICRSADVKGPVFDAQDFDALSAKGKTVYLLDAATIEHENVTAYIDRGKKQGIHKKYLPSCRNPWYAMEKKLVAPIWVSSACRGSMKFVRNLAMAKSLTTFHSVFVNPQYAEETDLIFSYFLTPTAQMIIRDNRKELGNGLEKFQPNDLNSAYMVDIDIVSPHDKRSVLSIYQKMTANYSETYIQQIDSIFRKYLL